MTKRIPWTTRYKVDLPEGESGDWTISKFSLTKEQADRDAFRGLFNGHRRCVPMGTYTQLRRNGIIIMTDTPDEIRDHMGPINVAKSFGGHILINGLGLGMVAAAVANMDNVEKVTVIELSENVIKLVEPTLTSRFCDKIEIIHADCFEYKPAKGMKFSVAWHDIWDSISIDNLPEMATLNRRYGQRSRWQGAWAQDICKRMRQDERRELHGFVWR